MSTVETPSKRDQVVAGNPKVEEILSKIEEVVEEHGKLYRMNYDLCAIGRLAQAYGVKRDEDAPSMRGSLYNELVPATGLSFHELYMLEGGFEHSWRDNHGYDEEDPWFQLGAYCYDEFGYKPPVME